MTDEQLTTCVFDEARAACFPLVGIASVERYVKALSSDCDYFSDWLKKNYHADMAYMKRQAEKRFDEAFFDEFQSVICLGFPYKVTNEQSRDVKRPWISQYAVGDDYHDILVEKLESYVAAVHKKSGHDFSYRIYVDTGPVFERRLGVLAGLGWIGKNTCLITREAGSFVFLAEVFVDLPLVTGPRAIRDHCGTCGRCLDACPTGALVAPYELDARKCISFLTIENKGEIPSAYHQATGNNLFGCDICQEVCPWNKKAPLVEPERFHVSEDRMCVNSERYRLISEGDFRELFKKSPIRRATYGGFKRNLSVVLKNFGVHY